MNILITGASSGFGFETSKTIASEGHNAFAGTRAHEGRNAKAASDLKLASIGTITTLEMDVASEASADEAVSQILLELDQPLDVVINNAGKYLGGLNETLRLLLSKT